MINLDTILSAFDDKFTLMKWLKQVEKALLDGVLTNASIVDVRDGQFKIKFTFADGSTQETNAIKIFDLDTLFTYFEGSESVIVDINESNTAIEIHLDAEVMAKIENALQLPKTRPTEQELVGVDTTGAQNRLTINELKALLGGGTKLYEHIIKPLDADYAVHFINTISTPINQTIVGSTDDLNMFASSINVFVNANANYSSATYYKLIQVRKAGPHKIAMKYFSDGSISSNEYIIDFDLATNSETINEL